MSHQPDIKLSDMPPAVQRIVREVVAMSPVSVTVEDVLGRGLDRTLVRLRWVCWWRQRHELKLADGKPHSYPLIGRHWGRDHSSIQNGVKRYEREALTPVAPPALASTYNRRKRRDRRERAHKLVHTYAHATTGTHP